LANSKTQNAFLFTVHAIFRHDYLPPSGGTYKYAKAPSTKKTLRDSLPTDMLLSAVYVLVVAQSSSEIPEGLMNNPVQSDTLFDSGRVRKPTLCMCVCVCVCFGTKTTLCSSLPIRPYSMAKRMVNYKSHGYISTANHI